MYVIFLYYVYCIQDKIGLKQTIVLDMQFRIICTHIIMKIYKFIIQFEKNIHLEFSVFSRDCNIEKEL